MPFVLAGVYMCWRCVNLFISDGAKTALIGGAQLTFGGERYEIFD